MDDTTILGSVLGQLGQTAKQAVKQVVKIPEEMVKDASGQISGVKPAASAKSDLASSEPEENKPQGQWKSDEERVKFLRDLYGSSEKTPKSQTKPEALKNKKPTEFEEQIADKSPDEQKKLMELRQQLHKQVYYDPTFNPQKKLEERPAEKIEKEKKMEALELEQKDKKKPPPLAVVRERNKAEAFRGAAG